jgi:beta-glucanase (GH16 family)
MKHFFLLTALALLCFTCEQEEYAFGDITSPQNLSLEATVTGQTNDAPFGDGSGQVVFTATADNAITYRFIFSDGSEEIAPSGQLVKRFNQIGVNTYGVTVVASGTAGVSTTLATEVTVESNFNDPEVVGFLSGAGSKTWYWAADEPGHLGVGQNDDNAELNFYANYYQAAPFEKDGAEESLCFYQDELVFSRNGDGLFFQLNNFGQTYFNAGYQDVAGGSAGFDFCYDFATATAPQRVLLAPAESFVVDNGVPGQTRGTNLIFSEEGFMSYYIGATTYEIISVTNNRLVVRAIQGNNPALAWYHIFSSTRPTPGGGDDTDYDNLVWSDEFDTDGAPNQERWAYDLGRGNNGWGNGESQTYTDRPENVVVADGLLTITARRENFSGANFTSARIKTENKFEFTYGRVDILAKLPSGGGTWPALWMLGEDYATNTWPGCGEIDIMEHVGNRQDELFSTLHFPGNSGGDGVSRGTDVPGISTEFHKFSTVWSPESIRFFVDDEEYHTFTNNSNLPFDSDFFLIFNVAMGGGFGGEIAGDFQESSMQVDWVRVYQ